MGVIVNKQINKMRMMVNKNQFILKLIQGKKNKLKLKLIQAKNQNNNHNHNQYNNNNNNNNLNKFQWSKIIMYASSVLKQIGNFKITKNMIFIYGKNAQCQ